jgi:hypothetical protein
VRVDDPVTSKTLLRTLKESDLTASAPERFAALALVELAEASWSELLLPTPTATTPPPPPEVVTSAVAQLSDTPRVPWLRIGLAGTLRGSSGLKGVLGGSGLWVWARLAGPFSLWLDAGTRFGDSTTVDGTVRLLGGDGAGFALAHTTVGAFVLGGGAGFRGGGLSMSGVPTDRAATVGRSTSGVVAGPAVMGHALWSLGRFDLMLCLETGWAIWRLEGRSSGATVLSVGGPWLSGSLGAAVNL